MRQPAWIVRPSAAAANNCRMSIDTDVAIVGGGPAGLSAATWLARHRRSAVVVDSSEYRNRWVDSSHGYLGNDPTSPDELRAAAHRDLARYDSVRVVADRVTTVTADGDAFTVQLQQAGRMTFSRLILATGVADQFPGSSTITGGRSFTAPAVMATRHGASQWS